MARKPIGRVLSWVAVLVVSGISSSTHAMCVAEAQTLAEAEQDVIDATTVYNIALAEFNADPNCETGETLAEAEIELEDAEAVRDEAQDEYDACVNGGEELQPIPLVIARDLGGSRATKESHGHSVLMVR